MNLNYEELEMIRWVLTGHKVKLEREICEDEFYLKSHLDDGVRPSFEEKRVELKKVDSLMNKAWLATWRLKDRHMRRS